MRRTQLDRGTDVVAIRMRRSVAAVCGVAAAVAVLGWAAAIAGTIVCSTWAIVAGLWLWLRPATSPVVRDPTPWAVHRPGGVRRAGSARRRPRASRRGS